MAEKAPASLENAPKRPPTGDSEQGLSAAPTPLERLKIVLQKAKAPLKSEAQSREGRSMAELHRSPMQGERFRQHRSFAQRHTLHRRLA